LSGDPYAKSARWYDSLVEPFARKLRMIGVDMFPPHESMSVLDVGCGTGTHLGIYQKFGCKVFGIDSSPAMLDVAHAKLDEYAELSLGDASQMIFLDESFDLILAMFVLHEMPAPIRSLVINEAKRVMRKTGRFLIIDYHSGPIRFPNGWFYRIVSIFFEVLAGREHFINYRNFMANRGMPPLIVENELLIDKQRIISGGTAGIYLLYKG